MGEVLFELEQVLRSRQVLHQPYQFITNFMKPDYCVLEALVLLAAIRIIQKEARNGANVGS